MSEVFLVGVDRSAASRRAVDFAAHLAHAAQGEVIVAHVVPWSPYGATTIEENEQRHPRRHGGVTSSLVQIAPVPVTVVP